MSNTEFLSQFLNDNPELIKKLENCTHHCLNIDSPNPYHMEGDILTHTLMVYNLLAENASLEVKLAALLHDIGKVITRAEKDSGRVSFHFHENVSTILAIPVISKYINPMTDKESFLNVLHLINWHGKIWKKQDNLSDYSSYLNTNFGNSNDFFNKLVELCKADAFGRVLKYEKDTKAITDTFQFLKNFIPYNHSQFHNHKPQQEVVFMVGISGSGKSTYLNNNYTDYEVVGIDTILGKSKLSYNNKYDKKNVKKAHDEVLSNIKTLVFDKKNVVIDMTNLTEEQRSQKLKLFPTTIYKHKAVVFLKDLDTIYSNLKSRKEKTLNTDIIERQMKMFELPLNYEFHEIEYIL